MVECKGLHCVIHVNIMFVVTVNMKRLQSYTKLLLLLPWQPPSAIPRSCLFWIFYKCF